MSRWQPEKRSRPPREVGAASSVPTDESLLDRYARGERGTLNELFRRHGSAAYRVAYHCLRRETDALDAVQEGFVKALRSLDGFRRQSSFKTWLLRIVQNAALDLRRQRDRRRSVERWTTARLCDHQEPALWANPAQPLERAELGRLLEGALASLPEAQRQTFVLVADAGLSCREVAEVLEVPIGTVLSRLFFARRRLQACLAAQGGSSNEAADEDQHGSGPPKDKQEMTAPG